MSGLLRLQIVMVSTLVGIVVCGGVLADTNLSWSFVLGYSMEMSKIISEAKGQDIETIHIGMSLVMTANVMAQLLVLFELGCYIRIYISLHKNDKKVKMSLTKKAFSSRRKKNVMTLSGQIINFVMETLLTTIVTLLYTQHGLIEESNFPLSIVISSSVVAVASILTSPELKKYYFKAIC